MPRRTPKLAVWKLASCDGCQLALLDCEDELLTLASRVTIAHFLEASRAVVRGPYDLSLIEGSVTTAEDAERVKTIRRVSRHLVAIGACATAGGIQALRNLREIKALVASVYPRPEFIATLATSTAVADHVPVDFELRGCPVSRSQLLEVVSAFLAGRRPAIRRHSVCIECKRRGVTCVMAGQGVACLGPVTEAGCGALCPASHRGCYGCFGPMETPNTAALAGRWRDTLGLPPDEIARAFRTYNANAPAFRAQADAESRTDG